VYQLILRLIVTMCVYACCDPKILVWSPNHQDSSPTSHHLKKHSLGLPLLTSNNKLPSWKNMEQQQNNMCFFLSFCCWCACGADVFFCFFHFLFCVVLLLPFLIYGESPHLSSQHWLESPGRFRPSVPGNSTFQPPSRNGDSALRDQLNILLMEEIPNNHLGWLKPLVNKGDKPPSLVVSRMFCPSTNSSYENRDIP